MPKEIPIEKQLKIVELSQEGLFRRAIANTIGVGKMTVFKYQKQFDLV